MRYNTSLIFYLFITQILNAQRQAEDYKSEFSITTENDNYAFTFSDGYYTNGLFLKYNQPARWPAGVRLRKVISTYELGQKIYVSQEWQNRSLYTIDRPFSGYLFFVKGYHLFYAKGHVLKTGLAAGATGKASLAKQVQSWYHKATGLPGIRGWDHQLNGEITLNASAEYHYNLNYHTKNKKLFEAMITGEANIGNAFTNVSAGLLLKLGNIEVPFHSGYYQARTGKGTGMQLRKRGEIFIYYHPRWMRQFYNATVQGPFFRKDTTNFSAAITRFFYYHDWGIYYSEKRWGLDVHFSMKNREAVSMRDKEVTGSVSLAYRFGRL